jgi:GDP-L-fucose synthase
MKYYSDPGFLNVGTGADVTISEFAHLVIDTVGYNGKIDYDASRPDGSPQKLLNVSKLKKLGWSSKISLREGLAVAYKDFIATGGRVRP